MALRSAVDTLRQRDQPAAYLVLQGNQGSIACAVDAAGLYMNTPMIQQVLAQPAWQGRLTPAGLRALTPLKWQHINPYGTFTLDMRQRLSLELAA